MYKDICINDLADISFQGIFIIGKYVYLLNSEMKKGTEDQKTTLFLFDKNGSPLAFYDDDFEHDIGTFGWISNFFSIEKDTATVKDWLINKVSSLIIINMFKTYAEVETKLIPPKSKIKDSNIKCLNETNLNLIYLDSKWFTNLVRSEGFTVNGHFRLQPKKVNEQWTKELIWIEAFEKHGYMSKARSILG